MKLDHIQLAGPPGCEDQARSFFVDLLGMVEVDKPEPLKSRGGCWFESGDAIIHIGIEEPFTPQQKAHPALIVEDLVQLAAKLETQGYPVNWDDALPDRKRFYTHDPFGNRIEFMNDGDGFSQR